MDHVTRHARARMQQRGIRPEALEALLDFGREIRAGRGRDLVFFDKRTRARAWPAQLPSPPARPASPPRKRGPSGSATPTRSSPPTAPSSPSATATAD